MPPQVEELLAKCERAMKARNYEEAVSGCRAILSIAPDHPRAKEMLDDAQSKLEAELFVRENLRKAQDAFQNRDYQKCVNECQKIQLLDPDNPAVHDLLTQSQAKLEAEPFVQNFVTSGQSLFDSGLYGEAIAQWEKVRAIDPMYPGLDALIQEARGKMGTSAPAMSGTPEFDLGGAEGDLNLLGGAGFGGAPTTESEAEIQRLLHDGDQLMASGEYQKAIDVWSEIFMLDVVNVDALQRIETARQKLGESPQAAAPAAEAGGAEAGSLEDLIARGNAAESAGQYREAAQFFSQALAIDADNADLADKIKNLNLLAKKLDRGKTVLGNARAFIEEGKLESARHALSKIIEADPENEEALQMMRELKGKIGATGPAVEARPAAPARAAARPSRPFPIIPAAAGVVILLIAAGTYFLFFKSGGRAADIPRVAKVEKKTTPKPAAAAPSQPAPAMVTPQARDAAQKAAQEADFYYQEHHDSEALQKSAEALKLDPGNQLAQTTKANANRRVAESAAAEKKALDDANNYFEYSDYAGAVKLYEKYLERHPEAVNEIQPQIIKCYYNLGVISVRQWKCDMAADYFRQVLFIDENDGLSKDALALARKCQQVGSSDLEMRKQVAFLEMRK